ncbi:hypothetical protein OBCHQ24_03305 [Oceanobacillus iheyensis]|nr:hypothetical protein OBCHQ24_03305 [Oceanobacillus iheyensis]
MNSISLDQYTEKIYHIRTKDYFNEVLQSYVNGSYRSAIVMLYSVVICDLVYKLKELAERYDDDKATQILDEIKVIRERDERSSEWENKLVEFVYERTNLLEVQDYTNIQHLKQHRNLSAHPVLDQMDILFNPNRETVRAHMRNILEGILIKPPILSNEIIVSFVEDIASVKETLVQEGVLERYLTAKYFNHIGLLLEKKVFRSLWKFVFKLNNPQCLENREVNFKVLKIMIHRRRQALLDFIEEEKSHFSDIVDFEDTITYLVDICTLYPSIYNSLEEHAKVILTTAIGNSNSLFIKAVFLSETVGKHFELIDNKIHDIEFTYTLVQEDISFLESLAAENGCDNEFYELLIKNFAESQSFNSADIRFENCILPYLSNFERKEFVLIFEAINKNSQIYYRRKSKSDNNIIKEYSDQIFGENFDYPTEYPNFEF